MARLLPVALLVLCSLGGEASAQKAKLVGRWQNELDPRLVMDLRADGSATTTLGEATWTVQGAVLQIGGVPMTFRFQGKKLLITLGAMKDIPHKRLGPPKKAPVAKAPGGAVPAGGRSPTDGKLRQLLLSTAWCSFTFNKHTGTSSTSRVVYFPNGTLRFGSNTETYNTGHAGTVAGQHTGSGGLLWKVAGGRLYVNLGQGFVDANLRVTLNSAGNPILIAGGKEYMRCK
ncbi:MAG: hypothetical protein IT371_06035 [Deltaproteobacteria bacterium]|nr:hypothetical protein [Deltaproteobacteria bacterium]